MNTRSRFFIGVDGGGTGCRVRLADAAGRILGESIGGAANVYLDRPRATATIRDTIAAVLAKAGLAAANRADLSLGLGLAGVSGPEVAATVRAAFPEFGSVAVVHDGVSACLGAHGGEDGGLVIVGTGSAAVLRLRGVDVSFGGRGFHLGDDGSGACLGRDLWRKVLRAYDGLEPWSPLLQNSMAEFGGDPVAVIRWGRDARSHEFAAFAPRVLAAARELDPAALVLVNQSAAAIGELIEALRYRGAPRISLVGGLAGEITPYLADEPRDSLSPPLADALAGALMLAGAPRGSGRDAK